MLLDLGACVQDGRERLGYRKVVVAGWSGGGAPMVGYTVEAQEPRITQTGRRPTPLAGASLPGVDGVLFLAAHVSRHRLLTDFLDASVTDELEPERDRDAEFDLDDPANPNQAPYSPDYLAASPDYLAAYRARQRERSARITAFAREKLAGFPSAGRELAEHAFVVHGTMARRSPASPRRPAPRSAG